MKYYVSVFTKNLETKWHTVMRTILYLKISYSKEVSFFKTSFASENLVRLQVKSFKPKHFHFFKAVNFTF